MTQPAENPWRAPTGEVISEGEVLFRDTSPKAFHGALSATVRALRAQPWLALTPLLLFAMHGSPAYYMTVADRLLGEWSGLGLFGLVWLVMPVAVTFADLWATRAFIHYFRTGERPATHRVIPTASSLRLAFPVALLGFPWSFVTFMVFAQASSSGVEFGRTVFVVFYGLFRFMHFFHAPLYADQRPRIGLYFSGLRALTVSPLRVLALGILFVIPTLLLDAYGEYPAIRAAAFLMYLPGALVVPGIAAYAYNQMANPGSIGTESTQTV